MGKVKKFVKSLPLFLLIGIFVGVYSFGHAVASPTDIIQAMDVSPAGYGPYNSYAFGSDSVSLSQDGRYVAFASNWQNLVTGANTTGQYRQIYLRDRATNITKLVSKNSAGNAVNNGANNPRISGDGRYVVYDSSASDLTTLTNGQTNYAHIYRYDTVTDSTDIVDYNGSALQSGTVSKLPSVSADGKYVAFLSTATNLDSNFTPTYQYAYVRNMSNGSIKLVSTNKNGTTLPNAQVNNASIDCSGSKVAFTTAGNSLINSGSVYFNKENVYYADLLDKTINNTTNDLKDDVYSAKISCSGTYITFDTDASNVQGPSSAPNYDFRQVYVFSIATKSSKVASTDANGVSANGNSGPATVSDDGRYVAFTSSGKNLGPNANNMGGLYLKNMFTGAITLLTKNPNDSFGNRGVPGTFSITSDGRYVGFMSTSSGYLSLTPDPSQASGVAYGKGLIYVTQTGVPNEY